LHKFKLSVGVQVNVTQVDNFEALQRRSKQLDWDLHSLHCQPARFNLAAVTITPGQSNAAADGDVPQRFQKTTPTRFHDVISEI
jgi:hypothetical protein